MSAPEHRGRADGPAQACNTGRGRRGRRMLGGLVATVLAVGAASLLLIVDVAPAMAALVQEAGLVTTRSGQVLEGQVSENNDQVTINADGIVTTVPRQQVMTIEYGTPEQRLRRRLEATSADDYAGRLDVAREALRRDLFDLAEQVVEGVLNDDPGNREANAVLDQIARQRRLAQAAGTGTPAGRPAASTTQGAATRPGGRLLRPGEGNVLDDEQINRVRQAELQPADMAAGRQAPRVNFRNNAIRRFVDSRPDLEFRPFNQLNDVAKALVMLEVARPEIREDVILNSNPISILEYVRRVEPFILNGCATSGCHGGTGAGGFTLYRNPRDDAESLTNFYVLNTYTKEVQGEPSAFGSGPVVRKMIDRDDPTKSLLLNYMLPRDRAEYPHPEAGGYNGLVTAVNAPNFRLVYVWIDEVLRPLAGRGYGFEFTLRPDAAAEEPATQPAEDPAQDADSTDGGM